MQAHAPNKRKLGKQINGSPHPRKAVVRQERSAAHRVWYRYVEVSIDRGRARAAHGESALYARSARAGGCSRLTPPPHGGGNAVHGADQRGRRLAGRYVLAKFRGWRRVRQQLTLESTRRGALRRLPPQAVQGIACERRWTCLRRPWVGSGTSWTPETLGASTRAKQTDVGNG